MKKHVFLNHKTSNAPASGSRRASFLILNEQEDGRHTEVSRKNPRRKDIYLAKMGYLYRIFKMGAVGATVGAVATITAGALFST